MKPRKPKVYSGTLDATKAAAFYDRLHTLRDALEALQAQYAADMNEVIEEASETLSVDPALIRMAFTGERQKRKRDARIAKMDGGKAQQLDLLADAACGTESLSTFTVLGMQMFPIKESQAKAVDEAHAVGIDRAEEKSEAPNGVETVSRGADARSSAATSELMDATGGESAAPSREDELFVSAVALVRANGKASTSYVQRHLQLGYNHAAALMERMEREGVISCPDHKGLRTVIGADSLELPACLDRRERAPPQPSA